MVDIRDALSLTLDDDPCAILPIIINKSGLLKRGDARDIYIYMWNTYYLNAKLDPNYFFSKPWIFPPDSGDPDSEEWCDIKDKGSTVEISYEDIEEDVGILQPNAARAIKKLETDGFITCLKKGNRWNPKATYQINIGIFEMLARIDIENIIGWDHFKNPYLKRRLISWSEAI